MVVPRGLAVPDDVRAVLRDAVPVAEVGGQGGRRAVHRVGEPRRVVDVALVLDAQRRGVGALGVVRGVLVAHHLGDLAVRRAHHVVGADLRRRVLEPADGAGVRALGDVDDDLVDRGRPARRVVAGGCGHPQGRRVVGALRGDVRRRQGALLRGDRAGGHGDPLAARHRRVQPLGQEGVHGVRVERGDGALRAAVAGDGRVPGVDVGALGAVQAERVGVAAQDGGAAQDVGLGVLAQLGRCLAGELGGLLQGVVHGVADQVHHAVAARLAGAAGVPVQVGLPVAEGGEEVPGHVVPRGGAGEGLVHRIGCGARGRWGGGDGGDQGRDGEGGQNGRTSCGVAGGASGHTCSRFVGEGRAPDPVGWAEGR